MLSDEVRENPQVQIFLDAPCLMRTGFHHFNRFRKTASGAGKQNQVNVLGFLADP
jgi:hypothetical protein